MRICIDVVFSSFQHWSHAFSFDALAGSGRYSICLYILIIRLESVGKSFVQEHQGQTTMSIT